MKRMEHRALHAKGTIVSPANREIVAHLEQHGAVKLAALQERFRNLALAQGKGSPQWLADRLCDLRETGHVRRFTDEDGDIAWGLTSGAPVQQLPEVTPLENVAQPRRISIFGPPWLLPKTPAARPGAMDYADVPSLHMGRRCSFRSGL
jgi:hypothetical protein